MAIDKIALPIARIFLKNPRRTLLFITVVNIALALLIIAPAAAQGTEATEVGMKFFGAGIAVAGSCIGAGIALQGATSAGLAALTEKPALAVWVLILAGLAEGVAIYGLIIAILILGA